MTWRSLLFTALAIPLFVQTSTALDNAEWHKPFPPFRIVGNLYWVGTWDLSSYLIVTPQGNILINSGLSDSVPMILANVESLGFRFSDIKLITATHGHFDHVAGLSEIKRLTGAKMLIGEDDATLMESGGKTDFVFGNDESARFEPVHVDQRLKEGDKINLGDTEITVHHHPGHTKGAVSFTLNIRDGRRDYRVVIANLPSINNGVKLSGMPGFPDIAQAYARTFHDQKEMQIDIFLASHASQFGLHEKHKPGDPYDPSRFVDPQGFHASVDQLEKVYLDQLATERRGEMSEVSLIDAAPRPLAVVRVTTMIARWPREFRHSLDKVYASVKAGQVKQSGHNVMLYRPRPDGQVDIECGIETPGKFEPAGEVVYSETPSGPAVTAVHIGPYERLGVTHQAIVDWSRRNGHGLSGVCWEIYGDWHNDPAQLRTDIFHALR